MPRIPKFLSRGKKNNNKSQNKHAQQQRQYEMTDHQHQKYQPPDKYQPRFVPYEQEEDGSFRIYQNRHPYNTAEQSDKSSKSESHPSFCHKFVHDSIWPGLGLFGESYVLFSIGTLKPLWEYLYPDCFDGTECTAFLLGSLTYSVVLGVMTGMLVIGYLANHIGRRRGSILTAFIMASGAWGLTLAAIFLSNHAQWLYRSLSILFFLMAIGIGGEYPLSASSASERAMAELQEKSVLEQDQNQQNDDYIASNYNQMPENTPMRSTKQINVHAANSNQQYRGRQVQLVFSMQGLGIFCNSITMTVLLIITGQGQMIDDDQVPEYSRDSLLLIWRITYALGATVLTYVLISRCQHLTESPVWVDDREKGEQVQRHRLLEAFMSSKREEQQFVDTEPPPLLPNSSTVSSLSAPSVTVDYHHQAVLTTGLDTYPHHGRHHHQQHHLPDFKHHDNQHHPGLHRAPSTDPEDDLKASPTRLFLQNYGLRLLGASSTWLLWDIAFYGNKLFQSTFLLALTGESTTLLEFSMAASLNAGVALLGYFGAAMLVDVVGRRSLQQYGFLITGSLFVSCGFLYFELSSPALVALYLGSSFFGQLGPNATTFLLPAEIFPTEMRTLAHGICAASGKAGALIAAIVFNYMDNNLDLFLFSGYASFAACLITFSTIPETLGLDLYEVDKKWRMILEGRKGDYKGEANHPKYLSYYERSKLYGHKTAHMEVE